RLPVEVGQERCLTPGPRPRNVQPQRQVVHVQPGSQQQETPAEPLAQAPRRENTPDRVRRIQSRNAQNRVLSQEPLAANPVLAGSSSPGRGKQTGQGKEE